MPLPDPTAPQPEPGPWDQETAEALTRAHELAAGAPTPPRRPSSDQPASPSGSDLLEARIADMAKRLQQSLGDFNPHKSLAVLNGRLDTFEARLEATLEAATAARSDTESLKFIEAHIREIDQRFEETRAQLARLDVIDTQLAQIARRLEAERQDPQADRIEAIIATAVERAAIAVAETMHQAPPPGEPARIDRLEVMLQEFIVERRQREELTGDILNGIEVALGRLFERVDIMDAIKFSAVAAEPPVAERDDPDTDGSQLADAYAEGARALGQAAPAQTLHAADYPGQGGGVDPVADASDPAPAPAHEEARRELRASAMRAKLNAQAIPAAPAAPGIAPNLDDQAAASPHGGRKPARTAGRWRRSLILATTMLFFGTASYVAVDHYLDAAPAAAAKPSAVKLAALALLPRELLVSRQAPADDIADAMAATPPATPIAVPPHAAPEPSGEPTPDPLPATIAGAALRRAALNGDPAAEFEIAARFAEGRGVAADPLQAFVWTQRAAMRGYMPAQFRLALLFERGIGASADPERGKVWYRRAAEQGHIKAMHNLAILLIGGKDDGDYRGAARWFAEAAERGLADSQYNLAVLYESGRGLDKDLTLAYKWYALAGRSGDAEAQRRIGPVRAQLQPAQVATAEQMVARWRAQPPKTATVRPEALAQPDTVPQTTQ